MSIKTKISLAYSGLFFLLISLSGAIFLKYFIETNKTDITKHIMNYAEIATPSIVHSFEAYKNSSPLLLYREIYPILENNPYLVYIEIVSPNGTILFNSQKARMGLNYMDRLSPDLLKAAKRLYPSTIIDNTIVHVFIPYIDEFGNHLYTIHYVNDLSDTLLKIKRSLMLIVLIILVSIVLSFIVSSLIAKGITAKLNRLKEAAFELEKGNLNVKFSIDSQDEIGELANVFENMRKTIKQNIERLKSTLEELKELDRMKNEFVANVSHELKTPLTSAIGYISLIRKKKIGSVSDEVLGALKIVEKNLNELSLKIDSILQISKFQVGINHLPMKNIDIVKIAKRCYENYRPVAELKGISLEFDSVNSLTVFGDEKSIESMICNLIDNAVKFTNTGKVALRIKMGKNRKYAIIEVEDTGIGIPQDKLKKIFDRFYQIESSNARRFGGIGLGLSIVKEVVDLHSGIIQIKSKEGKGTLFKVLIPVKGGEINAQKDSGN